MMDMIALQCFILVAEYLSFTKAAKKVGRTQSAVSQQIAKLENILGQNLLIRGNTPRLTQHGELFLTYARQIFRLQREALDKFKEPELEGDIHFGLPEDFAYMILSDILVEFSRLHPRIILNVECDLTINLLNGFEKNQFDLILVKNNFYEQKTYGNVIFEEDVLWIGNPKRLPELSKNSKIPLILSPSPCVYRDNVIRSLEEHHMDWQMIYSSPSYTGKMAAVKAGLGITAIQKSMIPSDLIILEYPFLPKLHRIQISLLKKLHHQKSIETLEYFLLHHLKNNLNSLL
jgi:DNA-binding transcriptional LysR family regulator